MADSTSRGTLSWPFTQRVTLQGNPHSLILGYPGTGKTYATKQDIIAVHETRPEDKIIIVDPEGEYNELAHALNGTIYDIYDPDDMIPLFNEGQLITDYGSGLVVFNLRHAREVGELYAECLKRAFDIMQINSRDRIYTWLYADTFPFHLCDSKLGSVITTIARRCRPYYGILTINTSSITDMFHSEYGKYAATCCDTVLLLHTDAESAPLIQKAYGLSEAEMDILKTADVAQGLIYAGRQSDRQFWPVKIEFSPLMSLDK